MGGVDNSFKMRCCFNVSAQNLLINVLLCCLLLHKRDNVPFRNLIHGVNFFLRPFLSQARNPWGPAASAAVAALRSAGKIICCFKVKLRAFLRLHGLERVKLAIWEGKSVPLTEKNPRFALANVQRNLGAAREITSLPLCEGLPPPRQRDSGSTCVQSNVSFQRCF